MTVYLVLVVLLFMYIGFNWWVLRGWRMLREREHVEKVLEDFVEVKQEQVKKITPEQVLDPDPIKRELISRAVNSGKIVTANFNEDGSVVYEELEPGVDWPDGMTVDKLLELGGEPVCEKCLQVKPVTPVKNAAGWRELLCHECHRKALESN